MLTDDYQPQKKKKKKKNHNHSYPNYQIKHK